MITAIYNSPVGHLKVAKSKKGICSILYSEVNEETGSTDPELMECFSQLDEYFAGNRQKFDMPLDMQGTEFQLKVWSELLTIPFGETLSYLELSKRIGNVKAIRAVGHANGQNKVNIIIPCHRVIGSNGSLTGYGGGLWRKKWLLNHEAEHSSNGLFGK